MLRKCAAVAVLVTLLPWSAEAQDARTVIGNASRAMGADNLRTIEYSGSGFDFALGQAVNPNAPWPKFINKTYTRAINFETPASRMDRIRMQGENPPRGGGNQPVRGEQTQNQTVVVTANTPWVQQLEIWMTPPGFLRAATTNNATVKSQTVDGKRYSVLSFTAPTRALVNGYVNDQNLVERVETWIDNAMLGDMLFEAIYTDYRDFGGVKFPTHIVQKQGGQPVLDLTISDVKPNAPVTIQAAQAGGGGRGGGGGGGAGGAGAAAGVPSERLADGVYLILGGYASVAVDFRDYIVVIEGPQSEARATAVINEAKRLIPNKPIRYVVNTHAHFDHASGLRTFVAEGATIITHEVNRPYYERIFALPHTLNPDRLAAASRRPTFETVTDRKVLTDGNHTIELHHVRGITHHDGLIMAYFPREKLLVQADAYNPAADPNAPAPTPVSPYNTSLLENVNRLRLDVARMIPVHYPADGRTVTMDELRRVVGQGSR